MTTLLTTTKGTMLKGLFAQRPQNRFPDLSRPDSTSFKKTLSDLRTVKKPSFRTENNDIEARRVDRHASEPTRSALADPAEGSDDTLSATLESLSRDVEASRAGRQNNDASGTSLNGEEYAPGSQSGDSEAQNVATAAQGRLAEGQPDLSASISATTGSSNGLTVSGALETSPQASANADTTLASNSGSHTAISVHTLEAELNAAELASTTAGVAGSAATESNIQSAASGQSQFATLRDQVSPASSSSADASAPVVSTTANDVSQSRGETQEARQASPAQPLAAAQGQSTASNSSDSQPDLTQRQDRSNLEATIDRIKTDPASARAQQVDAAIRLENATGQSTAIDPTSRLIQEQPGLKINQTLTSPQTASTLLTQTMLDQESPMIETKFNGRVVRGLSAMVNQRGGTMTMRLDPPDLGELRIQMTVVRGVVSAQFEAANQQAQSLLNKNLGVLRAALEGHGLTVERLQVQVPQGQSSQSAPEDASGDQGRGRGSDDARGETTGRDGSAHEQEHRQPAFASILEGDFSQLWTQATQSPVVDGVTPA